jgi:hypothetical protein
MAVFVLEIACAGVAYDAATVRRQERQIENLKSTQGRLTRRFRTLHNDYQDEIAALKSEVRELRSLVVELQDALRMNESRARPLFYFKSRVCADVFAEMIELAQIPAHGRRYSDNLYYVAVVILYRSSSTYDFLLHWLALPASSSVYGRFQWRVSLSLNRLQSVESIVPFLSSQIVLHKQVADGVTIAVDAVSCSNVFVGMKRVEESDIGYLFVAYLQPLCPNIKCVPLTVIPSRDGIGNPGIQEKIDEIISLARTCIRRVFVASDGDHSCNDRQGVFFHYWTGIFARVGLSRVMRELEN